MATKSEPVKIFCSYAPEDENLFHELEKHLSQLKRDGLISLWHQKHIIGGDNREQTLNDHLETASIFLLLVSADFFASKDCVEIEVPGALARHKLGEARVIPILIRETEWSLASFAHLRALPANGKPVTAWPNRDAAFAEIARNIREIVTEVSSVAASTAYSKSPAIFNVPNARTSFFTGREDELADLHQSITTGKRQAITGLGGVGKTSLAIEYAHHYQSEYPIIFWALASDQASFNSSCVKIAQELNLPEKDAQEQVRAVENWFKTQKDYLLILDNADDPDAFKPDAFLSFITHAGGYLLITTRSSTMRRLNIIRHLNLEVLTPEHGALLLLRRAGWLAPEAALTQVLSEHQLQAQHISQELGGLPLALEQAGAYLDETKIDLVSYLQTYQQSRLRLLGDNKPDPYDKTVATTWLISFSNVEQKNPVSAGLLRLCAFLAPDAIPEAILASVVDDSYLFNQACAALLAYSLIARNIHEHTFTIHRLVQAILRENLDIDQQRIWAKRAVIAVDNAVPEPSIKFWQEWLLYLPQVYACLEHIDKYGIVTQEAGRLLNQVGTMLRHYARLAEAQHMYERALKMREQALGPEHADTVETLYNLATVTSIQRRYEESLHLYKRVFEIRERTLGPEHANTAATINAMGLLYSNWRRYEEAQHMYERALEIRERVLGPEHPDTAETLHNFAMLYRLQGKYELAAPLFERALEIRERVLGIEDRDTILTLNGLAVLYRLQKKYELAAPLSQRALAIREKTLGSDHPETATAVGNLAYLYRLQGDYEQSIHMYERALSIREKAFGTDHPKATITCFNLGELYREQGNYEQAEKQILRALTTHESAAERSRVVDDMLKEYALLLHKMGRSEEAAQIEKRIEKKDQK